MRVNSFLSPHGSREAAQLLRKRLGVRQRVLLERISRWQVTDENGRPGGSLVGVVHCDTEARIYHTRKLTVEDLVHELLHVLHPDWDEARVVRRTAEVLHDLRGR